MRSPLNGSRCQLNGQLQELRLEAAFAVLLLSIVLKVFFFFCLIVNVLNLKDTQIH